MQGSRVGRRVLHGRMLFDWTVCGPRLRNGSFGSSVSVFGLLCFTAARCVVLCSGFWPAAELLHRLPRSTTASKPVTTGTEGVNGERLGRTLVTARRSFLLAISRSGSYRSFVCIKGANEPTDKDNQARNQAPLKMKKMRRNYILRTEEQTAELQAQQDCG